MSISEFYNNIKKGAKGNSELNQLYKKPKPENKIEMPHYQVCYPGVYYQSDVLYMPDDNGYKYILVCVDIYDNGVDAEPIKIVNSDAVLKAFKQIFKRKYLKFPEFITFDKGTEFNQSEIINYFKTNGTNVKYCETARHRQNGVVERMNLTISKILFKRMTSQELLTGETSKEWVEDLKPLIKLLNEPDNKKIPLKKENIDDEPVFNKYSGLMLDVGQKVRYKLDFPINNTNNARAYGNFRATDIRWSPKVYSIIDVELAPGKPPMYLIDDDKFIARTKNQLSVVKKDEEEPDAKFNRGIYKEPLHNIRGKVPLESFGIAKEILEDKTENNKKYYLIKWKGKNNPNSWIHSTELSRTKYLQDLRRDYNSLVG